MFCICSFVLIFYNNNRSSIMFKWLDVLSIGMPVTLGLHCFHHLLINILAFHLGVFIAWFYMFVYYWLFLCLNKSFMCVLILAMIMLLIVFQFSKKLISMTFYYYVYMYISFPVIHLLYWKLSDCFYVHTFRTHLFYIACCFLVCAIIDFISLLLFVKTTSPKLIG